MKKHFSSLVFFIVVSIQLGCHSLAAQSLASNQSLKNSFTSVNYSRSNSPLFGGGKTPKRENRYNNFFFKQSSAATGDAKTKIEFVGDGNIQKSFSEGSEFAANTGLGVVFYREWDEESTSVESEPSFDSVTLPPLDEELYDGQDSTTVNETPQTTAQTIKSKKYKKPKANRRINPFQDIEFSLKINIASTADTIFGKYNNTTLSNRRDFGTYLLIPVNSKQAASVDFYGYFAHRHGWTRILNGINVNFTASNSIWKTDATTSFLAGAMLKTGVFYDFVPDDIRKTGQYSVTLGLNYSMRALLGDLSFKAEEENRKMILGTDKKFFSGLEILLGIRLKNIRAEVSIPFLKAEDTEVPGLTNAQFVTSIRFVGGFPLGISIDKNR